MRVLRVYHSGRTAAHRARERALSAAGADVTLVVPSNWSEGGAETVLAAEPFDVRELPVVRPNDVNRHLYADPEGLRAVLLEARPDVVDVHEEPFSAVMRQVLSLIPTGTPAVGYSAQNVDKRYPPPFGQFERAAFSRLSAMYPCTRQAASVVRGRGYSGQVEVLPLGYDPLVFYEGSQRHDDETWTIALVGRLVPEKGVADALAVLAALRKVRPVRLVVAGSGPLSGAVRGMAGQLGVEDAVTMRPWLSADDVAALYRRSHLVLVPSRATHRWVEQFGRMIIEAQACGAVVVGYASGSIPEVGGGAAALSAEGDVAGLQRACTDIASLPELWSGLRERGRAQTRSMTWEHVAQRQIELYSSLRNPPDAPKGPQRSRALEQFGAPARLRNGQARPFAVPILRSLGRRSG